MGRHWLDFEDGLALRSSSGWAVWRKDSDRSGTYLSGPAADSVGKQFVDLVFMHGKGLYWIDWEPEDEFADYVSQVRKTKNG